MRAIRIAFYVLLAIVLILLAAANRGMITVSLAPDALAPFVGGGWSLTMPAFVALFLAMAFGVIVGLVWEWMRESHLRAESSRRAQELADLHRHAGAPKAPRAAPHDEVLAILDRPAQGKTVQGNAIQGQPATHATAALPAPR